MEANVNTIGPLHPFLQMGSWNWIKMLMFLCLKLNNTEKIALSDLYAMCVKVSWSKTYVWGFWILLTCSLQALCFSGTWFFFHFTVLTLGMMTICCQKWTSDVYLYKISQESILLLILKFPVSYYFWDLKSWQTRTLFASCCTSVRQVEPLPPAFFGDEWTRYVNGQANSTQLPSSMPNKV